MGGEQDSKNEGGCLKAGEEKEGQRFEKRKKKKKS